MESFYSAAYWGPRHESVDSCASRAQSFLIAIGTISPDFSGWRKRGRSKKEALASERITGNSLDALIALLSKGRNRRDIGGDVIDELGYSLALWNGGDREGVSGLSINCGLYSTIGRLSNAVVLDLPHRFDIASKDKVRDLMQAFAEAWEPDWAIVTSQSARDQQSAHSPYLDRALYVSTTISAPLELPASATQYLLPGGTLYVA